MFVQARKPSVANAVTEPEATGCNASKSGQIVGFDEFYAATLKGSEGARFYISTAPGAEPGDSYGLAGDSVEAMAKPLGTRIATGRNLASVAYACQEAAAPAGIVYQDYVEITPISGGVSTGVQFYCVGALPVSSIEKGKASQEVAS